MANKVLYYGVLQDGNQLAVVGYDCNCAIATKPIKRFPMGVQNMLDALRFVEHMDRTLELQR